jgi:hypothetical protein
LVLRAADRSASKHGHGELGVRAVCFAVGTTDELDGVQSSLQRAASFLERRQIDGIDIVSGRDPDGLPVLFMVHGPTVGDVEHYRRAAMLLYTVDV